MKQVINAEESEIDYEDHQIQYTNEITEGVYCISVEP